MAAVAALDPQMAAKAAHAITVAIYGSDPYDGSLSQSWYGVVDGNATSFDLPVCPALSAEMFPVSQYQIEYICTLEGPEITPGNMLLWFRVAGDPGYDVSLAMNGAKQAIEGPLFMTDTQ